MAEHNRWTKEECDALLELRNSGMPWKDVAQFLNRNEQAVMQKGYQLNAKPPTPEPTIEDIARERLDSANRSLLALEAKRQDLIAEKQKYMKILVALGVEEEDFKCIECGRGHTRKSDLTMHMNREHPTKVHIGEGAVS